MNGTWLTLGTVGLAAAVGTLGRRGSTNATEKRWTDYAKKHLVGRKIVRARYLDNEEAEHLGWYHRSVLLELDDGSIVFMSKDDEGNDAGALFGVSGTGEELTFPVLYR